MKDWILRIVYSGSIWIGIFKKPKLETSEDSLINLSLAPVDINGRDATDDNVVNPDHLDPKNRRLTRYVALVIPEST